MSVYIGPFLNGFHMYLLAILQLINSPQFGTIEIKRKDRKPNFKRQ